MLKMKTPRKCSYFFFIFMVFLFPQVEGQTWVETQIIEPGGRVAMSGGRALIANRIYEKQSDGSWMLAQTLQASENPRDVSLWEDRALVGRDLFERQQGGNWVFVQTLDPSDGITPRFGREIFEVSIHGEYALLGIGANENSLGAAYIFKRQMDGSWVETQKLLASDGNPGDRFGDAVSLDASYALLGARDDDELGAAAGSAYFFKKQADGTWIEVQKVSGSNTDTFDGFGISLDVDEDIAYISAPQDGDFGASYIFELQADSTWQETHRFSADPALSPFLYGGTVDLDGDFAVTGDFAGGDFAQGIVYIYKRRSDGTWSEFQKFTSPNFSTEFGLELGDPVAVSGNTIIAMASFTRAAHFLENQNIPRVTGLELINTGTDEVIGEINGQASYNLFEIGDALSVRALTEPEETGSVVFNMNGTLVQKENTAPYALNGNQGPNYFAEPNLASPGTFLITASAFTEAFGKGVTGLPQTVQIELSKPSVERFELKDSRRNKSIGTLESGDTIYLSQTGPQLSVEAFTQGGLIGSVLFTLNGQVVQKENNAPYALNGNRGANFFTEPQLAFPGDYTLTATPYQKPFGRGLAGESLSLQFTILENESPKPDGLSLEVFPNSVNWASSTTIRTDLGTSKEGQLSIYNSLGQKLKSYPLNKKQSEWQVDWQEFKESQPSMLILQLSSESGVLTKRLLMEK